MNLALYRKNLVFAAACLGMLLFGIVFLSLGAVVNMLAARFNLDDNSIGTLTALLPAGILAGSLVFGPVVDRYSYKRLLIVSALIVLLGIECIAFASALWMVHTGILLIGFGGGMLNGGTNALVSDISAGERGAKLSLLGVFFGIGALTMPTVLAVLSQHFSQTSIVAGIGIFVLLPIAYFAAIAFPPPKQPQAVSLGASFRLLKEPMLLLMGLILALQSGMEGMSNDWTPRYFSKVLSVSDQSALYALTTLVGAMTVTRLLLGTLLKRIPSQWVLAASMCLIAVAGAVMTGSETYTVTMVAILLLGIGFSACFPVMLGYIGDLYSTRSGTAFSIVFVLALIGNMTVNKTMGYIAHGFGIQQYPKVLLVVVTLAAILLIAVLQRLRKTNPHLIPPNEQPRETVAR